MLPIPVLHGCTIGELAQMINGEGWLGNNLQCPLKVITIEDWKHGQPYSLPVKPSLTCQIISHCAPPFSLSI